MQLFLEVLNDVLEFREIFRGRLDQGLVSFQHRLRPSGAVFFQRYWKSLPVLFYGAHAYVEKLVQPQATQRFRVPLIEINDRQTAFAQLAKPERDSSERANKRRIHHRTIAQIDDELAGTAMDHLLGKVSQSRAVCGRTVSLHPNPNDAIRTTYQYFRSRFHRFVSRGPLLQPQGKQHFCFLAQVSDDLPNGSGRQLDQRRSRQDMIAQNAPRVLQNIHNLYLVVIGQMVFADGAEVGDGSSRTGPFIHDVQPENERPFFLRSSRLFVTKRNHCPPPFGDLGAGVVFFPAPWELSDLFLKIFPLGLCSSSFLRLASARITNRNRKRPPRPILAPPFIPHVT